MSKGSYFGIQSLWSLVLSSLVWYGFLKNAHFDFFNNNDDSLAGMILFFGAILYLVLTIIYIIIGYKKVKKWKAWMIVVSLLIGVVIGFLGAFPPIYCSEWVYDAFN